MGIPASTVASTGASAAIAAPSEFERRTFAKIAWRLLPLLSVSYVLNYMDRNNVGFAALSMNHAIGLTAAQFGTGAGILFLGYCLFDVPSNIALHHYGTRVWIARIMITWGLISAGTIFVAGPKSWYLLRFLLGVAEAGFYPGIVFYITTWFPAAYRTRMLVWFLLAIPVSTVVGAPISGLLLGMDGVAGLAGWKWLFIIEGMPVVLLGFAVLWMLSDTPDQARWLTDEEKEVVRQRIASERHAGEIRHLWPALKDTRVLMLALVQFGFTTGSYGVGIWLPQIIKTSHISNRDVGFVTGVCYAIACVGMMIWAAHVDRSGKRIFNLTIGCLLSTAGLVFAILSTNFWASLAWVTVALIGINAARAIFWTIPGRFLTGIASAGGLAFINSVGTAGGFVGPALMGWLKDRTNSFSAGLLAMAGFLLVSTALSWSMKLLVKQE
jgi:MFS transporter, ACS family, tartrate transporter